MRPPGRLSQLLTRGKGEGGGGGGADRCGGEACGASASSVHSILWSAALHAGPPPLPQSVQCTQL
eukprot:scaffold39311_cov32-Tisochrysis_lutea.AAC.3